MKRMLSLLLLPALSPAAALPSREELLRKAGDAVESFSTQFAAVNCTESVAQVKLGNNGKPVYSKEAAFDYLIILSLAGNDLTVDESRMPLKTAVTKKTEALPLLVTNGFATFLFVFHPLFQSEFEYSEPVADQLDGNPAWRVSFRHVHGARSPSALTLRGREYPIDWQGTAWIDPGTGSILRITAGLGTSMEDLGLKALNVDVRYTQFVFKEDPGLHWLPLTATIEAETPRQHWRNVHTFSNYKHFSVQTKTEIEAPK